MLTMLRAMLAVAVALLAVAAALVSGPAAAQSADRPQHESGDAFYFKGTGGVPPV